VNGEDRSVSPRELIVNLISVVTTSGSSGSRQDTKEWRLAWWSDIYRYTVQGPYFFMGKGYGINLADSDGYQTQADDSLRSPHNSHLTFLARSGVPGFVIWIALLCVWLVQMSVSYWRARRLHLGSWAGLFVFVICYVLASLVNASFDPALEGPMMGIWFWSVVGLGIGASLVFPYGLSSPRTLR
jgi:O-antigen ligase